MTNLDLLLVNPSTRKVYQKYQESSFYPAFEPPYLAALTAEFIRNNGYEVRILDANVDGLNPEETAQRVRDLSPKLVQIVVHGNQPSASTQLMDEVYLESRAIKEILPETRILLTGTHPSALPSETLGEESAVDFVGRGEGFNTTIDILSGAAPAETRGLWFRKEEDIQSGPIDSLLTTQEIRGTLVKAAWDLLPVEKYRAHDWHCLDNLDARQPYASIYTSFGCPFKCSFCCINAPFSEGGTRKNTIRFRDPEEVVSEIEMLVNDYGIRNLKIIDEMFVFNQKHYMAIANGLIERGLGDKLNIWAYARIDTVKEGNLDALKKAGFNWLALGIESGSAHVREGSKKKIDEDYMKNVVKIIQNAGICIVDNYIFGLPDDNEESMQRTLALASDLKGDRPNFYCAMAYPGSQLHKLARQRRLPVPDGWNPQRALLPEEKGGPGWIGYSQHSFETWPLPTRYLFPEQVLAFRDNALKAYFQDKSYKTRLKNKFGQPEKIDRFCEINSKTPKRMILQHLKN